MCGPKASDGDAQLQTEQNADTSSNNTESAREPPGAGKYLVEYEDDRIAWHYSVFSGLTVGA
jgi:hypothetical protein